MRREAMGNFDDAAYKGLNLTTMIVIVLVILKIHGLTSLSWLWVFSPWWIAPFIFFVVIFTAMVVLFFVDIKNKKNK